MTLTNPISEDWLKASGFKWHQLDRQPDKHWLLWIGGAIRDRMTTYEDLGVEVAPTSDGHWFCWLRADSAGRYHRFIHVRHLASTGELSTLIGALIGYPFDPNNCSGGVLNTPEAAARIAKIQDRFDQKLLIENSGAVWHELEADRYSGRPLHEHKRDFHDARKRRGAPS